MDLGVVDGNLGEFLIRVVAGGFCGLLIGIDREIKRKPLGVRAYVLVSAASAAYMVLAMDLVRAVDGSPDPTRLVQGVVTGIGFLGAGAIMNRSDLHGSLRGVGSGAAVWCSGAVGVACGLGLILHGLCMALLILFVLTVIEWIISREQEKDADTGADK